MKQSTHSHSPASPVSRKLRSDSKLSALPPEAQSLLQQKLETQSYQETASWLHDSHGISVSPSNLSTFRSRHLENQALKEAYLQAATFHATLQDLKAIDPGDVQVEAAVRRLFLFKVVNQGDIGTYLQFTRVGNDSKKLILTQAREERLQQERQDAQGGFENQDRFNSPDLASSPLLSPLSALNPNPGPCTPRAQSSIGVGTSRPHTLPQDSNHSEPGHPSSSPNAPSFDSSSAPSEAPLTSVNSTPTDPALPPTRPDDLLVSFQQALDAVMPLDGAEPVSPSSLDPFYATIIGAVITRMLDCIQSGKFPPASSSNSAVTQSTPAPDQPSQRRGGAGTSRPRVVPPDSNHSVTPSLESTAESNAIPPVALPTSEAETLASSPTASPSNSLEYPQTPAIQSTKITHRSSVITYESLEKKNNPDCHRHSAVL